ncbi:organ-specific protein P4-like [Senna tora]|uniref:Organ-specific protein P4-like n=1 Tax=Senna tora TaxID=362788 RepID=A0A834XAX6_9FABA|nr:organ-specific protein P4-like [Senna tora]
MKVCDVSYGRTKDLEEYWKKSMEGQKMPEVIKDLVAQNLPSVSSDVMDEEDGFVREFDIKPNVGAKEEGDVPKWRSWDDGLELDL